MKKAFFSKICFVFFALALDAGSKRLALDGVPFLQDGIYPFGGIAIFDFSAVSFSLNRVVNTGIACGLFQGFGSLLLALRLCIISGLFAFLFLRPSKSPLPLWLIAAGALGNVIDMIAYGWVVDFFHFRFFGWSFPIFNVADSLITVGAALLLFWPKKAGAACPEH